MNVNGYLSASGTGVRLEELGQLSAAVVKRSLPIASKDSPTSLLEPLRNIQHPSLIPSVCPVSVGGIRHEVHKFLVLGKRAGGTPIRVCVFGGLDPGQTETIAAAAKVLTLLTLGPSLAEDYAIFGYPWVAQAGFAMGDQQPAMGDALAARWKADPEASDALFLRGEFLRIAPNGILSFRSSQGLQSARASVNSRVIAEEVVKPSLLRLRSLIAVKEHSVQILGSSLEDRHRHFKDGRIIPYPDQQPWPFDVELEVPADASFELKVQFLVLAALDFLRTYRAFVCQGGDL